MSVPLTVVMPARNAGRWIHDAVESILAQSFADFEFLVVVDDGSEDHTAEIARSFGDPRVRVLQPGRVGFVRALNLGFTEARGDWVARMDADDIVHPQRLDAQVTFLRGKPTCLFVSCLRAILTPNRQFLLPQQQFGIRWMTNADITMRRIQFTEGGTVFARRAALDVGLFDEDFENETSLYYKLLGRGRGAVLGRVLYAYRLRVDSHSKTDVLARHRDTLAVRQKYDPSSDHHLPHNAESETSASAELTLLSRLVQVCLIAGDFRAAREIARVAARHSPLEFLSWRMLLRTLLGRWKAEPSVTGWVPATKPW